MNKYFIGILLIFCSCKLIFRATGDIKNPKPETESSIVETVKSITLHTDGIYVCEDFKNLKYFTDSIRGSVPFVYIFDTTLRYVYKSQNCPWQNASALDSSLISGAWKTDTTISLSKIIKTLKLIDGSKLNLDNKYDHIIFYVWAKYVPKLSKSMIKEMGDYNKSLHERIYIGSINLDLQKSWQEEK